MRQVRGTPVASTGRGPATGSGFLRLDLKRAESERRATLDARPQYQTWLSVLKEVETCLKQIET